jgi:hypothetical protein
MATMIEPGNPTPLVDGVFDQLGNLFGLAGVIDISLDQDPVDLSIIEPQPLDLTGVRLTTVEDRITAELSIALMLQYDVEDVPVFGTIPVTIDLIGNSLAISDPLVIDFPGDFDGDGALGVGDINALTDAVLRADTAFDLTGDGITDNADRVFWVEVLKNTYFGDSNLDGEFSSADFVLVFQASQYEDDVSDNSNWETGDWNGDREFDSADFVLAFQTNGFENGPRPVTVPEPRAKLLLSVVLLFAGGCIQNLRFSGRQRQ